LGGSGFVAGVVDVVAMAAKAAMAAWPESTNQRQLGYCEWEIP
jgi:hypothetical protein